METSPFICAANQWIDFYKIGTSVMKELMTPQQIYIAVLYIK